MLKISIGTSMAVAAMVVAVLATAFVAAPSFAAQRHAQVMAPAASSAYAAAPGYAAAPVIVDGRIVGADPDANVRLQLRKEADSPYR